MKSKPIHDIPIYLDDINHLFNAPDFDPFAPKPIFSSGLDEAANGIKMVSRRSLHRLVLYLPAEKIVPNLWETTRQALDNFCAYRLEETRREATLLRWEGFEALETGLIFMAVCLFFSLYIREATAIPEYLRTFISEGLSIVGWVSMWKPVDIFLYQWWPHWQARFVYEKLQQAELVIRAR